MNDMQMVVLRGSRAPTTKAVVVRVKDVDKGSSIASLILLTKHEWPFVRFWIVVHFSAFR